MNGIEAVTGSRLHFGLICAPPGTPMRFGGIGMMIRRPGWRLHVTGAERHECQAASPEVCHRVHRLLQQIHLPRDRTGGFHVSIHEDIPLHQGLGSGTQLALAVAAAVTIAAGGCRPDSSWDMARSLQRGRRSAVGIAGFDRGGWIVDFGCPSTAHRRTQRYDVPESWRIVLVRPRGMSGLSGNDEESVFRRQNPMSVETVRRQSHLIEDVIVPALQAADFDTFSRGLHEYGLAVGRFFAPLQGGLFSSEVIRRLAEARETRDLPIVQSSWGPVAAIMARSESHAEDVCRRVRQSEAGDRVDCQTAMPLNAGAVFRSAAPEHPDHVARG